MEGDFQASEVFFFMIIGICVMLVLALALALFFFFSQKKLQYEQMSKQQMKLKHQEKIIQNTILSQEEERKRIAKDLHDDVGSKLNVIVLNMHRLRKKGLEPSKALGIIEEIEQVVNKTIDTTRQISHDLLPPTLESFGLAEALKELCKSYRKTDSIEVIFEIKQQESIDIDKMIELQLFRVMQELISNSVKHAQAQQLVMFVWINPLGIQLEYRDDGQGFDMKELENKGLGMQNLESRLNMIGATYTMETAIGKGLSMNISYSQKND